MSESNPSGMMEDSIIVLPYLEDDAAWFRLGQLWDCRTNKFAGVNLFEEAGFSKKYVAAHPVQSSVYELSYNSGSASKKELLHVAASVSIELCNGTIKVGGAASFDNSSTNSFDEEQLFCSCEITSFILKFHPNVYDDLINPDVKEDVIKGDTRATHYIGEIKLGAHLLGSLSYQKIISDKLLALSASVEGKMLVGPVSIGLKASFEMLDSESSSGYSKQINLESRPALNIGRLEEEVLTSKRMFELIESFKLTEPYQDGLYGNNVCGVPLSIKLIPISQLFDPGRESVYKLMEEDVLKEFSNMILTLHDYESVDHIKSLIRSKDPRLAVLFITEDGVSDKNPLAAQIEGYDTEKQGLAKALKSNALADFECYKKGKVEIEQLTHHLETYASEFDLANTLAKIEDFCNQGKSILNAIHAEDAVIADTDKLFLKTKTELDDWFNSKEDDKLRILLNTNGDLVPDGVFLKLFTIIPQLRSTLNIETKVAYPNIISKFSLEIKFNDTLLEYSGDQIYFILECLSVLSSAEPNSIKHLFYQGFTEMKSLSNDPVELGADPIGKLFPILKIFVDTKLDQVKICESYPEFRETLISATDNEILLVFPIQTPYSAWEVMSTFNSLQNMLEMPTVKFVFGYLQSNEPESPLLYVFKRDILLAVCMNNVDVVLCLEYLNEHPYSLPISPAAVPEDWLYHNKTNFALKTIEYLSPNYILSKDSVNLPKIFWPDKEFFGVTDALEVFKFSLKRQPLEIVSGISFMCIQCYPTLVSIFQKYFWTKENGFTRALDIGEWESLSSDFMFFDNEYIKKPRDVLDDAVEELIGFDPVAGQEEKLQEIVLPVLKIKIRKYKDILTSIKSVLDSSESDSLKTKKEKIEEIFSSFTSTLDNERYHLEKFSQTVDLLAKSEAIDYQKLCTDYINRISLTEELEELKEQILAAIKDNQFQKALYFLARVENFNPRVFKLHKFFYDLKIQEFQIRDTKVMKSFLELIAEDPDKTLIKFIFQNQKLNYWLSLGLNDDTLIEMIWSKFCKDEGKVPYYMSNEMSIKLNKFVSELSGPEFTYDYPKDWTNLNDIIQALQIIITRGIVPSDFLRTFRLNMDASPGLRKEVEKAGGLFYWNENELLFEEALSIQTVEKVLNLLMEDPENKSSNISENANGKSTDSTKQIKVKIQEKNVTLPLEYTKVNQLWKPFTGGKLNIFHENQVASKGANLSHPYINTSNLESTMSLTLPFVLNEILQLNTNILHPSIVVNFIDYLGAVWKPGQIPSAEPRVKHMSPRCLVSRSDILIAIFNSADALVISALLRILTIQSLALPLIVPYIGIDSKQRKYNMLSAYISGHPVNEIGRLLQTPSNFVVAVRIGTSSIGKSTILNQILFKEKNMFSSKAEQGSEYGKSIQREGLVELTYLTEKALDEFIWKRLGTQSKSHLTQLANIHGDILALDQELIEVLKPYVSCYIVFWSVDTWNDMKAKQKLLKSKIGPGAGIVHITINPNETLLAKVGEQNVLRTNEITSTPSKLKLLDIIDHAVTFKQKSFQPRMSSGVVHVMKGISTTESLKLIQFIKSHSVPTIKLAFLSSSDPILKEALALYCDIIMIPGLEVRKAALTHFSMELEYLSTQSSGKALEKVLSLGNGNKNINDSSFELDMKEALRVLDSLRLSPELFHNSLSLSTSNDLSVLLNISELFNSSWPIQLLGKSALENGESNLFNEFGESMFSLYPHRKLYVISIVGLRSSYKSSLLNALFGGQKLREGLGGCTNGIIFQLFHLEEKLQNELGIDSILVLDTEGICGPENKYEEIVKSNERKLVTFLMTISHCVIVNIVGTNFTDLKPVLEVSLINQCRLENRKVIPDLIFVCQEVLDEKLEELQNTIIDSATQITGIISEFHFELGLRDGYFDKLANIGRRLLAQDFIFPISPKTTPAKYFKDIKSLWNELEQTIRIAGTWITMADWYKYTNDCWTFINTSNMEKSFDCNEVQLELSIQTKMAEFRNLTNRATKAHFQVLETKLFSTENIRDIIDQNIREIPNFCKLESSGSSCKDCLNVIESKQSLFNLVSKTGFENKMVTQAQEYLKQSRQSLKLTLLQMLVAKEIEKEESEEMAEQLENILSTIPLDIPKAWIKFKQFVSDKQSTISALQGIENELMTIFKEYPEFQEKLPISNQTEIPYFETILSIDTRDYEETPLSPINLALTGMLTWEEATYLEVQLLDLPETLLGELGIQKYQSGLANDIISRVDEILVEFEGKFGWKLLPSFMNEMRFNSVLRFYWSLKKYEQKWDELYNPVAQLMKKIKKFPNIFGISDFR